MKFFTMAASDHDRLRRAFQEGQLGFYHVSYQVDEYERTGDCSRVTAALDAAYGAGARTGTASGMVFMHLCQQLHAHLIGRGIRFVTDDAAVFAIFGGHLSGTITPDHNIAHDWCLIDGVARQVAAYGMAASFASPAVAGDAVGRVSLFSELNTSHPRLAQMMVCADIWRFGMHTGAGKAHVREAMMYVAKPDYTKLRITLGGWMRAYPDIEAYVICGLTFIIHEGTCYIIDSISRSQLADVMWSAGNSVLYAMNYQGGIGADQAIRAAHESILYITAAIEHCHGDVKRIRGIARHMKTAYAIAIARYGNTSARADVKLYAEEQIKALTAAALEEADGFGNWDDTLKGWPDRIQVDLGTAWNLMPGVDIDVAKLDRVTEQKMNAPRTYDEEAWTDFMDYSRGAVTAHALVDNPGAQGVWVGQDPGVDPETLDWVIGCRSGTLTYPPRGNKIRLTKCLKYMDHMTNWHWNADSVTHVYADADKYESSNSMGELRRDDVDELLYALTHAPYLSGTITPEEARAAWERGKPMGDCVLVLAGKSENTKVPGKTRETGSADDVHREGTSEVEANLVQIAAMVEGVAMRSGRKKLEMKIGRLICIKDNEVMLIALDITGWSANAPREKHLGFIDMLLEFYEGTGGGKMSTLFKDVTVVVDKMGYHRVWTATDGTMQGFTGTGDSIMHSLIAQWAFVKARDDGHFPAKSKIAKIALIDDILIRLDAKNVNVATAYAAISANYVKLGYQPDAVKTLMSMNKGHFLNRLYANDFEVITASKIWGKANRSYERQYAGVWTLVDSVFAGYLGAADRGACTHAAYTNAVWRALVVIHSAGCSVISMAGAYAMCAAWMPRCLGGHGMPIFAQWVTREAADSTSSGLGAITTISRMYRDNNQSIVNAIATLVHSFVSQDVLVRSPTATMDDPYGIRVEGTTDPEIVGRSLAKLGCKTAVTAQVFRTLMDAADSDEYSAVLDTFLLAGRYPAPLIAAISGTLPHAVAHGITARAETSECMLSFVPYAKRHTQSKVLRELNASAVGRFLLVPIIVPPVGYVIASGSELAMNLRTRSLALSGYSMTYLASVSALDALGVSDDRGHIKVIIPAYTNIKLYTGLGETIGGRTTTTRALFEVGGPVAKIADPITEAVRTAMCVCAAASAYGIPRGIFEGVFSVAWLGSGSMVGFPPVTVRGSNPRRAASRIARRTYTVCMCPNSASSVIVDASVAIAEFELVHMGVDWMSIVYALKAAALLDMEIGAVPSVGMTRHYTLRALGGLVSSPDGGNGPSRIDYPPYDGASTDRAAFITRLTYVRSHIVAVGVDDDVDVEDSGRDAYVDAREFLNTLDPLALLRSVVPFPLAGIDPDSIGARSTTKADVGAHGTHRLPAGVARGASKTERELLVNLATLVKMLISGSTGKEMLAAAAPVRSLQHQGLHAFFMAWGLEDAYVGIHGVEPVALHRAVAQIHAAMTSSTTSLRVSVVDYWMGAVDRYTIIANNAAAAEYVRVRAGMIADILSSWSIIGTREPHALVVATASAIIAFLYRYDNRDYDVTNVRIISAIDTAVRRWSTPACSAAVARRNICKALMSSINVSPAMVNLYTGAVTRVVTDVSAWLITDVMAPIVARHEFTITERLTHIPQLIIPVMAPFTLMETDVEETPAWVNALSAHQLEDALIALGDFHVHTNLEAYAIWGDALRDVIVYDSGTSRADV